MGKPSCAAQVEAELKAILGANVVRLRAERELTQARLAAKTDLSSEWISLIERGNANPTLRVIAELAAALGVPCGALLSDTPRAP